MDSSDNISSNSPIVLYATTTGDTISSYPGAHNSSELTVYPNPVSSILYILSSSDAEIERYSVINVTGGLQKIAIEYDRGKVKIDFSHLLPGVYFIS